MVGLPNEECCLVRRIFLRVEKEWVFKKKYENISKREIWGKAQRETAWRLKSDCGKIRGGVKFPQ